MSRGISGVRCKKGTKKTLASLQSLRGNVSQPQEKRPWPNSNERRGSLAGAVSPGLLHPISLSTIPAMADDCKLYTLPEMLLPFPPRKWRAIFLGILHNFARYFSVPFYALFCPLRGKESDIIYRYVLCKEVMVWNLM